MTFGFRDTALTDLLETLGLVKVPSNFQPQSKRVNEVAAEKAPLDEATEKTHEDNGVETFVESRGGSVSDVPAGEAKSAPTTPDDEAVSVDPFLVDWNGPKDPDNPLNWPLSKKAVTTTQIMILTFVTYMGSSIYTPGQQQIMDIFGVSNTKATLCLSLYVLGYGMGPLIFSPLSEVPAFGRNGLYLATLLMFVIMQIPCATSPTFGGLVASRMIAGFFSSPSISTGGASFGDFLDPAMASVAIALWAVGGFAGPALGPLLGASMIDAQDYRLIFWFLMAVCGTTLVVMFCFFPETYGPNVLVRRARRVRKETGDSRYYAQAELSDNNLKLSFNVILTEYLYRPFHIMISEPGVLALDLYTSLIYATYYLFFEAYPIVYFDFYHFTLVEFGLVYVGFAVGAMIAFMIFLFLATKLVMPGMQDGTFLPEHMMRIGMCVSWLMPTALFLFGWTAQVHWIMPVIWEIFYSIVAFNMFQSAFGYLGTTYPRVMASVFAGNAALRSALACAFPLFGHALYSNLGSPRFPVGWGASVLAFISMGMAVLPFIIYRYGRQLAGRSKYAN